MGIPWRWALKAIPWETILANAPSIVRSADALVSKTMVRPDAASRNDVHALVMLTVAVASAAARQAAETFARAVGGVIEVENRLAARSDGAAVVVTSSKPGH